MAAVTLVALAPCAVMALALLLYPAFRLALTAGMGPLEARLRENHPHQFVGVLAASPALALAPLAGRVGLPVSVTASLAALVLFAVSYRDALCGLCAGIYRKGFVWRGASVPFAAVRSVERLDPRTLRIHCRTGRARIFVLADAESAGRVLARAETHISPLQ